MMRLMCERTVLRATIALRGPLVPQVRSISLPKDNVLIYKDEQDWIHHKYKT